MEILLVFGQRIFPIGLLICLHPFFPHSRIPPVFTTRLQGLFGGVVAGHSLYEINYHGER